MNNKKQFINLIIFHFIVFFENNCLAFNLENNQNNQILLLPNHMQPNHILFNIITQNNFLNQYISNLEKHNKDLEKYIKDLEKYIKDLEQQNRNLQENNNCLVKNNQHIQGLNKEIIDLMKYNEGLNTKNEILNKKNEFLEQDNNRLNQENKYLIEMIKKLKKKNSGNNIGEKKRQYRILIENLQKNQNFKK